MPKSCTCKIVGCLCRREAPIIGQGKCALCFSGQHSDANGRPLCTSALHRRSTIIATHRVLFDEGKQPLTCTNCAGEWFRNGADIEHVECRFCSKPITAAHTVMLNDGSLAHVVCNEDALGAGAHV